MRPDIYQPQLPAEVIHRLWLLRQARGVPMTRLLGEAVERYLAQEAAARQKAQEPR